MLVELTTCMNCGSKFNSGTEGHSTYLPEENHWEAECGNCLKQYELCNNPPELVRCEGCGQMLGGLVKECDICPVTQEDIERLRALLAEDVEYDDNEELPF